MLKNLQYIIDYSEGRLSKRNAENFVEELKVNSGLRQEYEIYCRMNEIMRAKADLAEVKSDPGLVNAVNLAKEAILDYKDDAERLEFIGESLEDRISDLIPEKEIELIKREIEEFEVDEIAEGWVKEYLEEKRKHDPDVEKMISFIQGSRDNEKRRAPWKIFRADHGAHGKSRILPIFALSAAAIVGGFLLFKTLVPSSDPTAVYLAYYKPMTAVSPVSRGENSALPEVFVSAISMYKQGNYSSAASLFNQVIQQDASRVAPHFYEGITQMELGNFTEAISQLSIVTAQSQDYLSEARWYLGLSYLRTGETARAIPYFRVLAETHGYYHSQARKILRRL